MAFNLNALGAGLGIFAENYRKQQEAQQAHQLNQLRMLQFQREQKQLQQERQAEEGFLSMQGMGALDGLANIGGGAPQISPIPSPNASPRSGGYMPAPAGTGFRSGISDPRGLTPYIQETAGKYGIDPAIAMRVASSEGLANPVGDSGTSFGALQLHTGGGMGDEFKRDTGLDPSDPANERSTIDYGLRRASQGGWGPWSGARRQGITGMTGIGGGGLAPGFARGAEGELTRDGRPPDTYIGQPGGRDPLPAWEEGPMRPTPASLRRDGAAPDTGSGIDPIEQAMQKGLQRFAQITDPGVYGRMSRQAILQQIEKAAPGADAHVKFLMFEKAMKLAAPEQKMQMQLDMANAREQMQRDLASDRVRAAEERGRQSAADKNWEVLTDPATGGQYRYQKSTHTATELTSDKPYVPGGAQRLGGAGGTTAAAGREKDIEGEIKRLDADFASANPDATKAQKDEAHFANRRTAEQGLAESKATPGRTPNAILMRKYQQENPKATYAQSKRAVEQMIAGQSIERAYGSGQSANQLRSVNTVAPHLLTVRRYAQALAEGDTGIPRANALLQKLMVETGHHEVTNMNVASGIAADEIVRLLTSTGGTEQDRRMMEERFKASWSQGQLFGAIRVAEEFVGARFEALEQGYARNDPEREQEFESNMLIPDARALYYDLKETRSRQAEPTTPPGVTAAPAGPTPAPGSPQAAPRSGAQPSGVIRYDAQGNRIQ